MADQGMILEELERQHDNAATISVLLPDDIDTMLARRQEFQLIKFRTDCTDCVPNF